MRSAEFNFEESYNKLSPVFQEGLKEAFGKLVDQLLDVCWYIDYSVTASDTKSTIQEQKAKFAIRTLVEDVSYATSNMLWSIKSSLGRTMQSMNLSMLYASEQKPAGFSQTHLEQIFRISRGIAKQGSRLDAFYNLTTDGEYGKALKRPRESGTYSEEFENYDVRTINIREEK